jgi:hypothetical protein
MRSKEEFMNRASQLRRKGGVLALISLIAVVSGGALFRNMSRRAAFAEGSPTQFLKPTGEAQLISVVPMPEVDGEMCQVVPASANSSLAEALAKEGKTEASPAADLGARTSMVADRAPVRTIHDPNPSFSAIAVEPNSDMLVVTDENLFRVLEYNRQDNTPPKAKMTEPKRVIGGTHTKAEMMCGVYIDPKTLDTYVVNNDTQDWLAIFSKNSSGNSYPDRELAVPHGTFGITVDEDRNELYLTVQHNNEVIVYNKNASGKDAPLRELYGDDTGMEDPHGVAIDTKNNLLFVINKQRETIYEERDKVLRNEDLTDTIQDFVDQEIDIVVDQFLPPTVSSSDWNMAGLVAAVEAIGLGGPDLSEDALWDLRSSEAIAVFLKDRAAEKLVQKDEENSEEWALIERLVLLRTIDSIWVEHLTEVDEMRQGIGLRGFAQEDPLNAFKKEAFVLYEEMRALIRHQVATTIFRVSIVRRPVPPEGVEGTGAAPGTAAGSAPGSAAGAAPGAAPSADTAAGQRIARGMSGLRKPPPQGHAVGGSSSASSAPAGAIRPGYSPAGVRMGRNDHCWCGSGKKYKKCHGS